MKQVFDINRLNRIWKDTQSDAIFSKDQSYNWNDFLSSVIDLTNKLKADKRSDWALFSEDIGLFSTAFMALVYAKKNIHLYGLLPKREKLSTDIGILCDSEQSDLIITLSKLSNDKIISEKDMAELNYSSSQKVILHTSGSTGKSKEIRKELHHVEREAKFLAKYLYHDMKEVSFYTTVGPQHIYGLLFASVLPISHGLRSYNKQLSYPESLEHITSEKCFLIASPAFLKRLKDTNLSLGDKKPFKRVFSSGGFLPDEVAETTSSLLNCKITQIYGSTETGGIAFKESPLEKTWTPFSCVDLKAQENATMLKSPFIINDSYQLDDIIEFNKDGSFNLVGRNDSIVKIEEKRVALNEVENKLLESQLVLDVVVMAMETNRQFLVVAMELNKKALDKFKDYEKKDINAYFRKYLSDYFHKTTLPKKWRYLDKLPRNSVGKLDKEAALNLFKDNN